MIALLVVPFLISVGLADQGCPPGTFISLSGDKCFNPVPLKTDFQTAEKVCASFGGHLASIHNRWDNDALIVSDNFGSYWLGGQDVNSNDMWSWTDGSIFNYNNFAAGGATAGRNCLLLDGSSALWQAYDCDFKANFICEYNAYQRQTVPARPSTTPATTTTTSTAPLPSTTTTYETSYGPTTPSCPKGYTCINGQYYVVVDTAYTWSDAATNCEKLNGNLTSIHNAEVEHHLNELLNWSQNAFWIGGQVDYQQNLSWIDQSPVDYLDWFPGAPDTAFGTTCLTIYIENSNVGWYNWNCDNTFPSVCAVPL
ncbi:hypothetical protein QR680_018633 [Steinernema hermaphroditum]|uniref:C-type lectin domain-containing protein n=1 Tax=Steinernema hermaphroditum TaxID=289476 RepID=A0AA39LRB6_9BILA|nr:hypothetical protein QR680_018633 [Steinernema hermaphroditum]